LLIIEQIVPIQSSDGRMIRSRTVGIVRVWLRPLRSIDSSPTADFLETGRMQKPNLRCIARGVAVVFWLASSVAAAPRDVQIVEVDFTNQVIELFNFGTTTQDLSGWQFCSHNTIRSRFYSSGTALNGISIAPGASLFVHLLSDSGGQPGHIDRPAGSFADPFDATSHGLQIYFAPVSFVNGATIADHVQWSVGGIDNVTADERSDEAELGGVWTDQTTWVVTQADSTSIMLLEESNGLILHGPPDYSAVPEPGFGATLGVGLVGLVVRSRRRVVV